MFVTYLTKMSDKVEESAKIVGQQRWSFRADVHRALTCRKIAWSTHDFLIQIEFNKFICVVLYYGAVLTAFRNVQSFFL